MIFFLMFIHVLVMLALLFLVLIQQGKGSDIGAAFGTGSANTVFGSQGSASFLSKLTAWLVVVFFATSLMLGYVISNSSKSLLSLDKSKSISTASETLPTKKR